MSRRSARTQSFAPSSLRPETGRTNHAVTEHGLLGLATLLMGLIAGFFYAYACSVMIGLAQVDDHTFIATMQAINATIRNAAFAPSFFGSLLLTGAVAIYFYKSHNPARHFVLIATILYATAFVITLGISVPMNNELAAAGPVDQILDPAEVRNAYEGPWILWNIIRTGFSTAALAVLILACMRVRRIQG